MRKTEQRDIKIIIGLSIGIGIIVGSIIVVMRSPIAEAPIQTAPSGIGILRANIIALADKDINFSYKTEIYPVSMTTLESWFEPYKRAYTGQEELRLNRSHVEEFLYSLESKINRPPKQSHFDFKNKKIIEIDKGESGIKLNIENSIANVLHAIRHNNPIILLAVDNTELPVTLENLKEYGISSLIGEGESDFKGSSVARILNIKIGADIFNGTLVAPGEEFSFNKILGPVDMTGGYKAELVIRKDKLIPEYGGGLCQVSTTLFRAAMTAGFPILERKPHSLPVRYYNPQGFDAAIYPGIVDLRFKNDLKSYAFIQSEIKGTKLVFKIFGKDDGREVTLEGPDVYEIGETGSLKTLLNRTITYAGGNSVSRAFYSSYRSPSSFTTVTSNPLE